MLAVFSRLDRRVFSMILSTIAAEKCEITRFCIMFLTIFELPDLT